MYHSCVDTGLWTLAAMSLLFSLIDIALYNNIIVRGIVFLGKEMSLVHFTCVRGIVWDE